MLCDTIERVIPICENEETADQVELALKRLSTALVTVSNRNSSAMFVLPTPALEPPSALTTPQTLLLLSDVTESGTEPVLSLSLSRRSRDESTLEFAESPLDTLRQNIREQLKRAFQDKRIEWENQCGELERQVTSSDIIEQTMNDH